MLYAAKVGGKQYKGYCNGHKYFGYVHGDGGIRQQQAEDKSCGIAEEYRAKCIEDGYFF